MTDLSDFVVWIVLLIVFDCLPFMGPINLAIKIFYSILCYGSYELTYLKKSLKIPKG
jgi:hypothetical protein